MRATRCVVLELGRMTARRPECGLIVNSLVPVFRSQSFGLKPWPPCPRHAAQTAPPCTCAYATLRPLPLPSTSTWCGSCARPAGGALRPACSARPALRCLRAPQAWIVMKTLIVVTAAFGARNRTAPSIRPCSHRMPLTLRYTISNAVAGGAFIGTLATHALGLAPALEESFVAAEKMEPAFKVCAPCSLAAQSPAISALYPPVPPSNLMLHWPLHLSHPRTHTHTWMPLFPFS